MANSRVGGMRLNEFYAAYLKPQGFVLYRDNGQHGRRYRHTETGVMFDVCCDENAHTMSSPRVDTNIKELTWLMSRVEQIRMQRRKDISGVAVNETAHETTRAGGRGRRLSSTTMINGQQMRKCPACGRYLPVSAEHFPVNNSRAGGFGYECRDCSREKQRNWRNAGHFVTDARLAAIQAAERRRADASAVDQENMGADVAGPDVAGPDVAEAADVARFVAHAAVVEPEPRETRETDEPAPITPDASDAPEMRAILALNEFVSQPYEELNGQPAVFVSQAFDFVVARIAGKLYLLTPDAGPGEPLTPRSMAYILRLMGSGDGSEIRGALFF